MATKKKAAVKQISNKRTAVRKKTTSPALKAKSASHKKAVTAINKMLTDAFWINRTLGNTLEIMPNIDPFNFVITIEVNPAITIASVNVNGVRAKEDDFKVEDGKILCTVKAIVSTLDFLLIIEATGEPETETSFNLTCDGVKVFSSDKKIRITGSGKGLFSEQNVPLP